MSAIETVEIEGFRGFKRLRVEGLTPVSVFVGANNAGKSALLEGIEVLASGGDPSVLARSSVERGEFRTRDADGDEQVFVDPRHWFHGNRLHDGAVFQLSARGDRGGFATRSVRLDPTSDPRFAPMVLSSMGSGQQGMMGAAITLYADGYILAGPAWRLVDPGLTLQPPVAFVTTNRLVPRELARLWSRVELTPGEDRVLDALRLVEPKVERISIADVNGHTTARVRLRGDDGPVPLGTLGEGVGRTLTLAVHLTLARGGVLLIDEIENGLHWSVMPRVWRFLVETARALDVQVFVSTHSRDCLEAIAELHRDAPELAARVSVHRLEVGRETTVRLDAGRVDEQSRLGLEVR